MCGKNSGFSPDAPEIPEEAIEFAKAVGSLADQHGLRDVDMTIRIDTGYGTKYWIAAEPRRRVQETMRVLVSLKDGRGRPRTQVSIRADVSVSLEIVHEPDSSN